jgi:hypothetical protein
MATRRYKSRPIEPIPATHEPLIVDFTFSDWRGEKKLTFYCASHFKRVNLKDEDSMIGYFTKLAGKWDFSGRLHPTDIADSDLAKLKTLVFEYFDAGWE